MRDIVVTWEQHRHSIADACHSTSGCKRISCLLRSGNVDKARELLGTELAALVGESYERAYGDMVRVQQLTELEEVINYTQAHTGRA